MDGAALGHGMGLGMGSTFFEYLGVFGNPGVFEQPWSAGGGDFLFCGGGGTEAPAALSDVAGDEYGAREGRQRRTHRGAGGVESRSCVFSWRGCFGGVFARGEAA